MADAPAAVPPAGTPASSPTPGHSLASTPPETPPAGDPPKEPVVPEPPKEPAKPEPAPEPAAFALDKIKLPEGMKTDDPLMQEYSGIMTNDKLSPAERGQQLLDLYAKGHKLAVESAQTAWDNVQKDWQTKTMADPEVGGSKWAASKATIAKAIDSLGPDLAAGFREALDATGAGNHPAIVKALHSFASKLVEGTHVTGAPPTKPTSIKDAFYPNSPDMK